MHCNANDNSKDVTVWSQEGQEPGSRIDLLDLRSSVARSVALGAILRQKSLVVGQIRDGNTCTRTEMTMVIIFHSDLSKQSGRGALHGFNEHSQYSNAF